MMKEEKITITEQLLSHKKSQIYRRITLILALIFIVAFVFCANNYQQSGQREKNTLQAIDEQIGLANHFYVHYLQLMHGDMGRVNEIEKSTQRFNLLLADELSGESNLISPNALQQEKLRKVKAKWQQMRGLLTDIVSNKSTIAMVREKTAAISVTAAKIHQTIEALEHALVNTEQTAALRNQLDDLSVDTNRLDNLIQSVLPSGSAAKVAVDSLSDRILLFIELSDDIKEELDFQGGQIYKDLRSGENAAKLTEEVETITASLSDLTSYIPAYVQVAHVSDRLENKSRSLVYALRELKETFIGNETYPIEGVPVKHSHILIILLSFSGLFLALWAWQLIRNSNRLYRQAVELQLAAERRNEQDKAAVLQLMDELANLSDGDLTVQAEVTEDYTGAIADSINISIENMRDMVGTLMHTSNEIIKATTNTQSVAKLLAESSRKQSDEITHSNVTAGRISASLGDVAQHSDESAEIARSSVKIAQDGRERVKRTVKSMRDIRDNIQDTSKRIKRLGESSQEIGDIVEIIKSIADQTNILALNAAIQATSAGESGKGFAVVADEVQRLAERSGDATKQIEALVKTIQADANEAVASMENSTAQVVNGTNIAEEAGQSLDKIERVSHNLSKLIINVSDATRQAANMAHGVADNMDNLAALNKKSVQDVSSSVQSVDNLGALSEMLKESVAGFKLPNK